MFIRKYLETIYLLTLSLCHPERSEDVLLNEVKNLGNIKWVLPRMLKMKVWSILSKQNNPKNERSKVYSSPKNG